MAEPGSTEGLQAAVIFNPEGSGGKPPVVITSPETGAVLAVGNTPEEADARLKKLNETPMSVSNGVSDEPNPAWFDARAWALGLTKEKYDSYVTAGVEDVGLFVAKGALDLVEEAGKWKSAIDEGQEHHDKAGIVSDPLRTMKPNPLERDNPDLIK